MKQRIISAIVALIICIPIVIIGGNIFIFGISVLGLIGYKEILDARGKERDFPFIMKLLGLISFALFVFNEIDGNVLLSLKNTVILSLIMLIIPIIFINNNKYQITDALYLFSFSLFLGIAFNSIINVRTTGIYLFIYLISITIITDTFAYFTGVLLGKHKMCPKISPNKTWEGAVGGLVFGTIASSIIYITMVNNQNIIKTMIITILLSVICQIGDLIFSAIKRTYKIKDYGKIMPGHGGVLDRLDSLLWVAIVFDFIINIL